MKFTTLILLSMTIATTLAQDIKSVTSPVRLDKVADLEIRLLNQKISNMELQLNVLRQSLNTMVAEQCKSKNIDISQCVIKLENDKSGEYLTLSKVEEPPKPTTTTVVTKKEKSK